MALRQPESTAPARVAQWPGTAGFLSAPTRVNAPRDPPYGARPVRELLASPRLVPAPVSFIPLPIPRLLVVLRPSATLDALGVPIPHTIREPMNLGNADGEQSMTRRGGRSDRGRARSRGPRSSTQRGRGRASFDYDPEEAH